jgi:uncharacterized protein
VEDLYALATLGSLVLVGVVAGFFGSTVGGGSLLSIPFLIFLGLPPQTAITTDRLAGLGAALAALCKYGSAHEIRWKFIPLLATLSLGGSLIGANLLLTVDPTALRRTAGSLLLALLPVIFFWPDIGVRRRPISWLRLSAASVDYFLIQAFAGFFGAGTGPFITATLLIGFGLTIIEAAATQVIPLLILSISSVWIFAVNGLIDLSRGLALFAGMATGGFVGAHVALQKGSKWLKRLFGALVIVAAIRLLLL